MTETPVESCDREVATLGVSLDAYYADVRRWMGVDGDRRPTHGQHIVGRQRLHYLDWGTPDQCELTALMLHGGGLNAHSWDALAMRMSDRFRVLAVDLRGHGDSEWSPATRYAIADHERDISTLTRDLCPGPYLLMGMSLGGLVSMAHVQRPGARPVGLVLIDVGPRADRQAAEQIRHFIMDRPEFADLDEAVRYAAEFRGRAPTPHLKTAVAFNVMRLPSGRLTWKYDRRHRTLADLDVTLADADRLERDMSDVTIPIQLLIGARSQVISDKQAAQFVSRLPSGELSIIAEAGHNVQSENPHGTLAAVTDFINRRELASPRPSTTRS